MKMCVCAFAFSMQSSFRFMLVLLLRVAVVAGVVALVVVVVIVVNDFSTPQTACCRLCECVCVCFLCVFYLFVFPTFQLKRYVPPGPVVAVDEGTWHRGWERGPYVPCEHNEQRNVLGIFHIP